MRHQETDNFAGITVNERLFACDLMDDFDRARSLRDVEMLRLIFARIELPHYPVEELLS